ncbi:MAG: Nif3-like dinuclear metal center hexameric protein [Bacteroidota bacterium]|nr:Nif3-like dinuclear metal center hexameric protein [Bacteroidota bacterium]
MKIIDVIEYLEEFAPLSLQEDYDNAGLLTGKNSDDCIGILTTLDVTEEIVQEAINNKCNLIVAHHPVIFRGLKKLNGSNYVERTIIAAIKNDIAIYVIHTNLDNVINGVNKKIAEKLELQDVQVLSPAKNILKKLVTFSPTENAENVRSALFTAGGKLGNYSECSFNVDGTGTFKAGADANPYIGEISKRHEENETRIELIFPAHLQKKIVKSLKDAHPYEEAAYDIYALQNETNDTGSGLVGNLPAELSEEELLSKLKSEFCLQVIRHSPLLSKKVSKIALCGGAGSFLLAAAKSAGADAYITSDIKYHEFFDADGEILLADIGHFESEQFTISLLADILKEKFPNFAVQKTKIKTNPVNYYA